MEGVDQTAVLTKSEPKDFPRARGVVVVNRLNGKDVFSSATNDEESRVAISILT